MALLLVAPCLSACASSFQVYSFGSGQMWIGEKAEVHRECVGRGATFVEGERILGCTDFNQRLVISIPDPKIIAHEMCHWSLWTESHEACPLPTH